MEKSRTIVCYGDSNTHGYDSRTITRFNEEERWTSLLSKYLGKGYYIKEEGLNGRTTVFSDIMGEGRNGLSYLIPCLESHEPIDLLIFMLGTNDTKEVFHASAEDITKGMEKLIKKSMRHMSVWREKPNILILAPFPIDPAYESAFEAQSMGKGCSEKSKELAERYKTLAEKFHCHFLDVGSIPGIEVYPTDYLHLTKKSHQILAEVLAKKIHEIFL